LTFIFLSGIFGYMNPLKEYRSGASILQADFAASVGVSQATISKIESGEALPGLFLAVRIQRATGGKVPATSWVPAASDQAKCPCAEHGAIEENTP
jgi:DNA-binding XRE family transcriptional regulator